MNYQNIIETSETVSIIISKLMQGEKYEDLYRFCRKFDLTPELIKEHLEIILEFHSKSKALNMISRKSSNKFSKYYSSKMEKKSTRGTKKSKKQKKEEESIPSEEEEEEYIEEEFFNELN